MPWICFLFHRLLFSLIFLAFVGGIWSPFLRSRHLLGGYHHSCCFPPFSEKGIERDHACMERWELLAEMEEGYFFHPFFFFMPFMIMTDDQHDHDENNANDERLLKEETRA